MAEQGHDRASLTSEWQAGMELARLLPDPVFAGVGLPRGDGRVALVIPGLFGNDWYLNPLRRWLSRLGYRPLASSLAFNAGCPERRSRTVAAVLDRHLQRRSGPVALIGHSRGGILATVLAARLQERVSHLALLGSPVGALLRGAGTAAGLSAAPLPASPLVVEAGLRVRRLLDPDCSFPECGCPFVQDLSRPLSPATRVVSLYTAADPVVPAAACLVDGAECIEVEGTHSGLVYNREVYRALARFLAARD